MTFNLKACQSNLFKIIAAKTKKTNQADGGVKILYEMDPRKLLVLLLKKNISHKLHLITVGYTIGKPELKRSKRGLNHCVCFAFKIMKTVDLRNNLILYIRAYRKL